MLDRSPLGDGSDEIDLKVESVMLMYVGVGGSEPAASRESASQMANTVPVSFPKTSIQRRSVAGFPSKSGC